MTNLTPELKKHIETFMVCSERLERALEILDKMNCDDEELKYLIEIEYQIRLEEEKEWNKTEEGICPTCGGPAPW